MNWRHEFQGEFSDRIAWLVRNDRKTAITGLIRFINAVWFAGLWQAGFPELLLFVWLGFFIVSMLLAARLEFYKESKNG